MEKYWEAVREKFNTDEINRGIFIIFPLKAESEIKLSEIQGDEILVAEDFDSEDFIELLNEKCKKGDFVKRFSLNGKINDVNGMWKDKCKGKKDNSYQLEDLQLFLFHNGTAFLTTYLTYVNSKVNGIYKFVNPGYIDELETKAQEKAQEEVGEGLLQSIEKEILQFIFKRRKINLKWFLQNEDSRKYIIKEAYRLNVAAIPKRFENFEIPKRIAYNQHRLTDVTRDFEDMSEADVAYTTGAKDVDDEHYGWACAITSQEISYAYGPQPKPDPKDISPRSKKDLLERAQEDLHLTMLVMYQKYACMILNEKIHRNYTEEKTNPSNKRLRSLKHEALKFIAYGTLAPSQVSRWNNVCETYRLLQKETGVNEALEEIKEKINMLNEEQDNIDSKREAKIGMIITVFGFISIIGAVLQILDYVLTGGTIMLVGLAASLAACVVFGMILVVIGKRNR